MSVPIARREQEDLRIEALERELELLLAAHLDDAVEPELERFGVRRAEPARRPRRASSTVTATRRRLRARLGRRARRRQRIGSAVASRRSPSSPRTTSASARAPRRLGRVGVLDGGDDGDAVAFRDRLTEAALASHGGEVLVLADRVPDGLQLEEARRSPTGSARRPPRTTRFTFSAAAARARASRRPRRRGRSR